MADQHSITPTSGKLEPSVSRADEGAITPMSQSDVEPAVTPVNGQGEVGKRETTDVSQNTQSIRESSGEIENQEDIFDVQLSQIPEDPNRVNVHQFYPELEHQFMKGHSTTVVVTEQAEQVTVTSEKSVQESVDEDGDSSDRVDSSSLQMVPHGSIPVTPQWTKEDENNSSDPQKATQAAENEGLFSTAVDEKTLEDAKSRQQQSIFQTEKWGMEKPPQPSMKQIMEDTVEKHFQKALKLKDEGKHREVVLWINKALGIRGGDVRLFVERAEAYLKLCDFQSAILNYKKACLLDPANEQFYNRLAFLYYFQGQCLFDQRLYPEALESFSRAAEMNSDNVGYHIRSITCLAALQRHGECLALVNKRLEIDKDNADLYIMRARLHEMFRNTTLSYYDVKDAIGLDPEHTEAVKMMDRLQRVAQGNKRQAMQLNLVGKHREALQKISIAIETDPAIADFHVHRGALHRKLGDYNAAIDDFLLALDKCDHNEDSHVYIDSQRQLLLTYNDFAVECFSKGFFEEAIILLNKAVKGEKREKGLYVNRGDCFFRQDDMNFAYQDYHQALDLDPSDETIKSRISVIHNEYGVSAYQEKNYTEAETRFTQALEFHPKVGQYYISRARARYMLENMTGARGDLLMGLLIDPENEDVISILSRLFPGKSVGDVLSSRAAESAKMAIRSIFAPPQPTRDDDEESIGSDEEVEGATADVNTNAVAVGGDGAQSERSDTQVSGSDQQTEVSGPVWRPGAVSQFRFMMEETEFNIKLVEMKQGVNGKVKSALIDRKSLKYKGPRMKPLPPPNPKPTYGGRGLRREKIITPVSKEKPYNWRQFNMGIGLGDN